MIKNLNNLLLDGIIVPGEMYILSECERDWDVLSIEELCLIKEEHEIVEALEMEFLLVAAGEYDRIKFLMVRKIDKNSHEFLFECIEKATGIIRPGERMRMKITLRSGCHFEARTF
ncbi:MAG TPA: hypothetical protein VGM31_08785 [Puia sp.]|jgi:hypothetical protein